jgi:sterol desaturase/sphingolipid hydroxylase (fatty acid hydroxylase superfamily)
MLNLAFEKSTLRLDKSPDFAVLSWHLGEGIMKPEVIAVLIVFALFSFIEMWRVGLFKKAQARAGDGMVELISTLTLLIVTQPMILFVAFMLMSQFFPSYEGSLAGLAIWAQIGLLLIFDDMLQYWWHRLSHTVPFLYKLHRPHHNAGYMSVRLVYRNSILYYMTMPSIWGSAVLVYLGLGWTYAFYIVVKLTVITGAHCDVQWDAPLYKIKALSPIMWVVERIISTPSTHSMHHGKHKADGITHYKGNYGNLLFFWDVLFGTAQITRQRPPEYGVEDLPDSSVGEQLLWPLVRVKS